MPTLPNLALDHIEQSQSQKEVTANEALDRLDASVNTYLVRAMTDANFALVDDDEYLDAGTIEITGTLTAARTVTVPAHDRKITFFNNTTGGFPLTFTKGSGTTVTLANKAVAVVSVDTSANKLIKVGGGSRAGEADDWTASMPVPDDTTITYTLSASRGATINSLVHQLAGGACTVAIKINGVNVTGLSAVSVGTVKATTAATAANTVVAGDVVTIVITNTAGSPTTLGLALTLLVTYTE